MDGASEVDLVGKASRSGGEGGDDEDDATRQVKQDRQSNQGHSSTAAEEQIGDNHDIKRCKPSRGPSPATSTLDLPLGSDQTATSTLGLPPINNQKATAPSTCTEGVLVDSSETTCNNDGQETNGQQMPGPEDIVSRNPPCSEALVVKQEDGRKSNLNENLSDPLFQSPMVFALSQNSQDLALYYACYSVLGDSMFRFFTFKAMMDCVHSTIAQDVLLLRMDRALLISYFPQVQMDAYLHLRSVLRGSLANSQARSQACELLRNLSRNNANKPLIMDDFGYELIRLLDQVDSGAEAGVVTKRFVIGTLNNLATNESNAMALLQNPGFVETVLSLVDANTQPDIIRERALWTLQSLATVDETGAHLLGAPVAVDLLTELLCSSSTVSAAKPSSFKMTEYVLETLRNLARSSPKGVTLLFGRVRLANEIFHLARHGPSESIRALALTCLNLMGCGAKTRDAVALLETLCGARNVPRTSHRRTCLFRVIPGELVRRIAEGLFYM